MASLLSAVLVVSEVLVSEVLVSAVLVSAVLLFAITGCSSSKNGDADDGIEPLRVVMIPADGGTEEGTIADFRPIFSAISREYDIEFDLKVAQSYNAVVQGMVNDKVDVAWFGPVSYSQAKKQGVAQLLAVGVFNGESVYYSGIFTRKDSGLKSLADLKGKSVAFGDVNSTSSFNFPIAMLIEAGLDPVRDLGDVHMTGSHTNAMAALDAGRVDAACASYSSFEKAVANGHIDPKDIIPLAKSDPIPYPPMAMHVKLDESLKKTLRKAFNNVHNAEGITPDMIRGYGGKKIDRYNADFSESEFDKAMSKLAVVTDELKSEIIKKASDQ